MNQNLTFPPQTFLSAYTIFKRNWIRSDCFLETVEGQRWTYADLDAITDTCSRRLQGLGLKKGERLVSQLERSPWNLFLYLACMRAGVIYVPLSPGLTMAEAGPIIDDVEPALLVCDPALETRAVTLMHGASERVLTMDVDGAGSFERLAAGAMAPDVEVAFDDDAVILFTSGTTGRPKGAVLPHHHFALRAHSLVQGLGYRRDDKLLHTLPLYHAHGLFMTTHCVLCSGASILLLPRFDPAEVVKHLPRVTMFSGVPTMYKRLLGTPMLGENSRAMRLFIVGSAALPPDVFARFEEQTGQRIVECWGMTETMTNCANPIAGLRKPGSAGKPLPGVQVYAAGPDGQPLPPGQPGALTLKATTRFSGYWRRPEAEQPRYRDGFFTTGDIGYIDEDGYLIIVGRNSDVIISGGFNVYPREVELALEQMEGVGRAAVFGLPHPDFGEAVTAAVEYHGSAPLQVAELQAKLKLCLASYKVPKAVFPVAHLPLTELGKIQRRVLVEQFKDHYASAG